jgi:hypothetical protein
MERFGLEPIVALPPDRETIAMGEALRSISARGIRVGLWPLMSDAEGYWPSEHNAEAFFERTKSVLLFAERHHVRVSTIAVDLEPPLEITRRLMKKNLFVTSAVLFDAAIQLRDPARGTSHHRAILKFEEVERFLSDRGIETLAAVMPTILLDVASGTTLWQSLFRTPAGGSFSGAMGGGPAWSVISPMLYTTLLAPMLPSASLLTARSVLYEGALILAERVGRGRASLSLGLVGTGKLGHEPSFPGPDDLRRDVETALSAGIDDLALFSLEGVLERGRPESWLLPYTAAAPKRPSGLRAGAVSAFVRAGVSASRPVSRLASCFLPRAQ